MRCSVGGSSQPPRIAEWRNIHRTVPSAQILHLAPVQLEAVPDDLAGTTPTFSGRYRRKVKTRRAGPSGSVSRL
jgi:hypothetical protein